jgi:hypothetical protein
MLIGRGALRSAVTSGFRVRGKEDGAKLAEFVGMAWRSGNGFMS